MVTRRSERVIWPTEEQRLLLRASLLTGKEAVSAWSRWKENFRFEQLEYTSRNLLPLLFKNLKELQVHDPLMPKFKGIYRYTWSMNQLKLHSAQSIVTAFKERAIESMVLKGIAMALLYYRDLGLRPMSDMDILVPRSRALEAIRQLQDRGWDCPQIKTSSLYNKDLLDYIHGLPFFDSSGQELDLHWSLMVDHNIPDADLIFWRGAVKTEVPGTSVLALNPTDQLLHVIAHGVMHMPWMLTWIPDAMVILGTKKEDIDWCRFITLAQDRHLMLYAEKTLISLKNELNAPIPHGVLKEIRERGTTRLDRICFFIGQNQTGAKGRVANVLLRFYVLNASRKKKKAGKRIRFLKYLQYRWDLDGVWKVLFYTVYKAFLFIIRPGDASAPVRLNYQSERSSKHSSETETGSV